MEGGTEPKDLCVDVLQSEVEKPSHRHVGSMRKVCQCASGPRLEWVGVTSPSKSSAGTGVSYSSAGVRIGGDGGCCAGWGGAEGKRREVNTPQG